MSALTFPTDRPSQEAEFLTAIRSVKPETFSQENAAAFVAASEAIIDMVKAGFAMDTGFEKINMEHLTPVGLYNMLAKDLVLEKGKKPPEGMPVSQVAPTTSEMTNAYQAVLNATMDAGFKLVMHTMGDDEDMAEFGSMASLMTMGDGVFLGRCLNAGLAVDLNALHGLERKELVGLANDSHVLALLKALPSSDPLIAGMNEINGLIMLRPEELKAHLLSPARSLIPDELLNHGFHCAVSDRAKPEALEIWLQAGASVEGSSRNIFDKTALGSAIFASPLHGRPPEPAADAAGLAVLGGDLQSLLAAGGDLQAAPSLGGLLATAQANGTQIVGPGGGMINLNDLGGSGTLSPGAVAAPPAVPEPPVRCTVELLIAHGAQVNPLGGPRSPLAQAYEKGSPVLIDLLEANKAVFNSDAEKRTAYLSCAEHGSDEALKRMLSAGMGIDTVISRQTHSPTTDALMTNEHTALTMAAMMGRESTVKVCLESGANPEITVTRTIAHAREDEVRTVNFLQEAMRLDQPKVLAVAVEFLGKDRVLQERVPHGARQCQEYVQGLKAAQALDVSLPKPAPAP